MAHNMRPYVGADNPPKTFSAQSAGILDRKDAAGECGATPRQATSSQLVITNY